MHLGLGFGFLHFLQLTVTISTRRNSHASQSISNVLRSWNYIIICNSNATYEKFSRINAIYYSFCHEKKIAKLQRSKKRQDVYFSSIGNPVSLFYASCKALIIFTYTNLSHYISFMTDMKYMEMGCNMICYTPVRDVGLNNRCTIEQNHFVHV